VDSAKAAARGDDELFDIAPNADHICQVIVRGEKQASEDSTLQRCWSLEESHHRTPTPAGSSRGRQIRGERLDRVDFATPRSQLFL